MIQTHFSDQALEAMPTGDGGTGATQVVIYDFNGALWPS
jgi:hypothetical protein